MDTPVHRLCRLQLCLNQAALQSQHRRKAYVRDAGKKGRKGKERERERERKDFAKKKLCEKHKLSVLLVLLSKHGS